MTEYITIVLYVLSAAAMVICSADLVHILQLEGYKNKNFIKWLAKNFLKVYLEPIISLCIFVAISYLAYRLKPGLVTQIHWIMIVLYIFMIFSCRDKIRIRNAKKPLVYTGRVKRLFVFLSVFYLLVIALLYYLDSVVLNNTFFEGTMIFLLLLFIGDGVFFANLAAMPIESRVKKWYFNDAKKKLEVRGDLIRIGITGSFGKTSCKFILSTILSEKYNVLTPPSSYNTPMGLTRVIREQMESSHEVFIAEMGARNVGDIEELCGLVHPKYGLITSVGPQHLETFGSIENIAKTKYELIEGLPHDGCAFFPADKGIGESMYEKTAIEKYLFGFGGDEVYARAVDIQCGAYGSRFDLIIGDERISCETRLLGRHNIANITGCACVAKKLGLTSKQIRLGIRKIIPVEHRLQFVPTANGITIIDDAFNSNPSGVRAALEVLSSFDGRRIVVTPGMVELGKKEKEENKKFGQIMADAVDVVYLIGPQHTAPIYDGLIESGFKNENIWVFNSLDEATKELWQHVKPGDVIIFENDLPDNYNE